MESVARHPRPPELRDASLEDIAKRYTKRFIDTDPDWNAYADASIEGFKRARHGYIGKGVSGRDFDPNIIPPRNLSFAVMFVNPGQGNAAHTHETEEIFFVLQGRLSVFLEDESGQRLWVRLNQWDCVACPPGVIHGYHNESHEPVYIMIMLGKGQPEFMGYADQNLYENRGSHLETPSS